MPAQTSMLHVRVEDNIKAEAAHALDAMGLSMAGAVRLFLHRVVAEQAFPLELKVPNARTRAAMAESRAMMNRAARFNSAQDLFDDLEKTGQ